MKWEPYRVKNANEKYLYKFLSQENLMRFLKTGAIWFSRADIFGDKMECVRIPELQVKKTNYAKIQARKKTFLISCWHLADRESLVLWDTYSDTLEKRRTTAIRFEKKNLIDFVELYSIRESQRFVYTSKFIHGKVAYKTLINVNHELLNENAMRYPAFRKEAAFKYENEYRFVIQLDNQYAH